jgi:hypothetical protein
MHPFLQRPLDRFRYKSNPSNTVNLKHNFVMGQLRVGNCQGQVTFKEGQKAYFQRPNGVLPTESDLIRLGAAIVNFFKNSLAHTACQTFSGPRPAFRPFR